MVFNRLKIKTKFKLAIVLLALAVVLSIGGTIVVANIFLGSSAAGTINLQKGLVGHWDLNGNAEDRTPNSNDGTVTGATLTTDRKSQSDKAYSFDGTDDRIVVSTAASSPFRQSSAITYSFWTSIPTGGTARLGTAASGGHGSGGVAATLTSIGFSWTPNAPGNDHTYSSTISLTADTWHHIAVVITFAGASTGTIYLDGVSQSVSLSGTGAVTNGTPITSYNTANGDAIGARYVNSWLYGQATIDDTRIYNRALTAAEVTALYNSYDPGIAVSTLQKGLVGYWDLNGNAEDRTPNSNDGTVTTATLTTDRKGQTNKAYHFDGSDDYITLSPSILPTAAITVAAWVQLDSHKSWSHFVKNRFSSEGDWILFENATLWEWGMRSPGTTQQTVFVAHNSTAAWTFLVGTYDGTTQRLYVNGVEVGTPLTHTVTLSQAALKIGDTTTNSPDGKIDDVRIYNRALSAAEVTALYNSYDPGIAVSTLQKGLVGHWDFNGNAEDRTPNSNDGTVTGATLTTDRNSQSNKAYSFNGVDSYVTLGTPSLLNFERTNTFSVSAWIKSSSISTQQIIIGNQDKPSTNYNGWALTLLSSKLNWYARSTLTNRIDIRGTTTLLSNIWYHVVYTYDGSSTAAGLKAYINGTLETMTVSGDNLSTSMQSTKPVLIGLLDLTTNTIPFNGSIDDVRIYNRALTAAEVLALYNSYR